MNIDIVYFSGTGNTAWVVREMARHLENLGDEVQAFSCEEIEPQDRRLTDGDVLGIAFPVHGSWAPRPFRAFLAGLPAGQGRPLFALACAAYAAGDAAWYAARPLASKGYTPFLYGNVFMPNNLIYPVPSREQVHLILDKAGRKVAQLAALIHERRRHIEGVHPGGWLVGLLQRPLAEPLEGWASHRLFADETCTHCGWCARHCPVGNIEMVDGEVRDESIRGESIRWGDDCLLCLRCFHGCPQQAIQWGDLTRNEATFRRYPGPEGRYRPPKHEA
ncbi:MAG: EFR1 family ferrodoxin [Anaerolineae bacterium]